MEYIQNPIILGLLTSCICFLYLKWNERKEQQEKVDGYVDVPSLKYPIIMGILVFLGVSIWNRYKSDLNTNNNVSMKIPLDIVTSSPLAEIKTLGDSLPHIFIETN